MNKIEDTKEYLNEVRHIDQEISAKEEWKQKMWGRLTSVGSSKLKEINVQESQRQTIEDRIIKYVEYTNELDELVDNLVDKKMTITREIEMLEERTYRTLLIERYINNKDWQEVADCLGYERKYTLRLHNDAIREFKRLKKTQ